MQIYLTYRNSLRNVKRRVLHTRGFAMCYITRHALAVQISRVVYTLPDRESRWLCVLSDSRKSGRSPKSRPNVMGTARNANRKMFWRPVWVCGRLGRSRGCLDVRPWLLCRVCGSMFCLPRFECGAFLGPVRWWVGGGSQRVAFPRVYFPQINGS